MTTVVLSQDNAGEPEHRQPLPGRVRPVRPVEGAATLPTDAGRGVRPESERPTL